MVVGGEQGLGPQPLFVRAVFQHRPGDGHTVVGGRAPADLVQNQQRAGGGVFQHGRHLGHLHHEGGLPRAQVVGRADAGKHPVHHPDPGGTGGDEAAHLRHEHDEGHLTHIGGLARHVGSGDDGQPVLAAVHMGIVGNKEGIFQHPLHHRVAALFDVDDPAVVHRGAAIAVLRRYGGERTQHVQVAYAPRHSLHLAHPLGSGIPQMAEQLILQRRHPALGGQNLVLQLLQLLGEKPLAVHQGLLADVILRHQAVVAFGHLDVIAEHLVIAHFEALDAGALLLPALQRGHHVRAVVDHVPEVVHLVVIALADEAALPDGEGQAVVVLVIPDGLLQQGLQVPQAGKPVQKFKAPGGRLCQVRGLLRQHGQHRQPIGQRQHIPGVGAAVHHLADDALQVGHLPQGAGQLLPRHRVRRQRRHLILPDGNGGGIAQGLLDPGPDQPVAHGGLRLVQHPQQRALFLLAPDGLGQLQGAPGGEIKLQIPLALGPVHLQAAEMAQVGFLSLLQVGRQRPRRLEAQQRAAVGALGQLLALRPHPAGHQRGLGLGGAEAGLPAVLAQAAQAISQKVRQLPFGEGPVGQDGLAGGLGGQAVQEMGQPALPPEGGGGELPGGQVALSQPRPGAVQVDGADEVVPALVQHHVVHGGAGGDDADHVPVHQALRRGRVLHLLTDGHLVPPLDEPGDVALRRVVGHAAHGGALLLRLAPVPGGEGQAQLLRAQLGVVVEHLVEVAQPEEQQAVRVLLLHLPVLLHHGGQLRHFISPLPGLVTLGLAALFPAASLRLGLVSGAVSPIARPRSGPSTRARLSSRFYSP